MSRRQLAYLSVAAFLGASIVMTLFVLPAEFGIDLTGFGRLTGLTRLAGGETVTHAVPADGGVRARKYDSPYRTAAIEIPLAAGGDPTLRDQLEYKVRMQAGGSFVYSWSVPEVSRADEFYFDFHGETPAGPGNPQAVVVEYLQATGTRANGVLVAPIDGVHGWFLQNKSSRPVVVHLRLSGFYELIPPGDYGNQAGIVANEL
jgi:hypothetical protein